MKTALFAAVALALAAGPVSAQPIGGPDPISTVICLDPSGSTRPPVCRVPASRLDRSEYMCQCWRGMPVDVAICPRGVRAPAESRALDRARRSALRDGSLLGATFQGRPMCVDARRP